MRFDVAVDIYVSEQKRSGRINSQHTEDAYRSKLTLHGRDVMNRDPSKTGREDVRRTLRRWEHPNSQRQAHAVLRSFYDFALEEGWRKDNPARQIRLAKHKAPNVFRMTQQQAIAVIEASKSGLRDHQVASLGILAGLRSQELRLLQGRHFELDGWIWVSGDIAKGGRQRYVPIIDELEPVVQGIRHSVGHDAYVLPARRNATPPGQGHMVDITSPQSASSLYRRVRNIGRRAGLGDRLTPHAMRRAFADLIARNAGVRSAQVALGHADLKTTDMYLTGMSLDELRLSFSGLSLSLPQLPVPDQEESPRA